MSFITDKQTLDDLNLLGRYKNNSIFHLFNQVKTEGGEALLQELFRDPLTSEAAINQRSATFRYFGGQALVFPFGREEVGAMERYLSMEMSGSNWTAGWSTLRKKGMHFMGLDKEYPLIEEGFYTCAELLKRLQGFLARLDLSGLEISGSAHWPSGSAHSPSGSAHSGPGASPFLQEILQARRFFSSSRMDWLGTVPESALPLLKLVEYDKLLRRTLREEMTAILKLIYSLDVYIAVSVVAVARGFTYATALPEDHYGIHIRDCRHPALDKAVANSVQLDTGSNVLFLTGANMAGKSTFMKSFSIAVYLAHMGFPVAASGMEFSVRDGIFTSINVPDNLKLGYSHFYAEVRRVKQVAEEVGAGRNLVVIFDELFKGTNVKDAFDATLAVTAAFASWRNCFFIISTHITEVAEALAERCDNLQFVCFPTLLEGNTPRYTYRLQPGVTTDRHGMRIIQQEGVVEIIRKARFTPMADS